MSSNTKVVVFKAKELLYTGIFLLLGIILILLLIFMFLPKITRRNRQSVPKRTPYTYPAFIRLPCSWEKTPWTFR